MDLIEGIFVNILDNLSKDETIKLLSMNLAMAEIRESKMRRIAAKTLEAINNGSIQDEALKNDCERLLDISVGMGGLKLDSDIASPLMDGKPAKFYLKHSDNIH